MTYLGPFVGRAVFPSSAKLVLFLDQIVKTHNNATSIRCQQQFEVQVLDCSLFAWIFRCCSIVFPSFPLLPAPRHVTYKEIET